VLVVVVVFVVVVSVTASAAKAAEATNAQARVSMVFFMMCFRNDAAERGNRPRTLGEQEHGLR
jgi:hypothetical protein